MMKMIKEIKSKILKYVRQYQKITIFKMVKYMNAYQINSN
jgi:hypothetical protein